MRPGALSASVHVRLVQHENQLVPVALQPLARFVEDWTLERPHEHVLKHRVVRY